MATGIVLSVDPIGTTGQVQVDETGETLPFNDPNFPSSGLSATAPNNAALFAIDAAADQETAQYYATGLKQAPPVNKVSISSSSSANVTANVGDVITISGSGTIVSGDININGGKIIIDQAQVSPTSGVVNVTADGIIVARNGGQVTNGNININTGGSMKVVNNGQVTGTVVISQAGRMIVGNANGPGIITGTIDIKGIRAIDISGGSVITGSAPGKPAAGGGTQPPTTK